MDPEFENNLRNAKVPIGSETFPRRDVSAVQGSTPRRGIVDEDLTETIEDITSTSTHAKHGRRARKFGKGALAGIVAGTLAVGTLFAFALHSRGGNDAALESVDANAAVPAAAVEAARMGFADRSEDVSRNALREGISDVKTNENARERTELIDQAADEALASESQETAKERERLMAEDLKLVDKQAAKLKQEAQEAAKLFQAANQTGNGGAVEGMSAQDIAALSASGSSMPIKQNFRIGAGFGQRGSWSRYHTGQDFPAPVGTPVYAVAPGVVLSPTAGGWAGTNVVIQHKTGATLYAHLSRRVVSPGQAVKPGQIVGYVGTTGRSFGPHLHFEYYPNGTTPGSVYTAADPMTFLRSLGVK